jgi:hypothetical protein
MSSIRQIAANRRNSQKSTGPRTGTGKAASSANALKSGIYSKALVIRGEDPRDLETLTAEFFALYQPAAPDERSLVDTLVATEWLLRRTRRCEALIWEREFTRLEEYDDEDEETALGAAFAYSPSEFRNLQIRLTALDRTFHRALTALARLRKSRQSLPDPPQPNDSEPVASKLASFPKNREAGDASAASGPPREARHSRFGEPDPRPTRALASLTPDPASDASH